MTRLFSIPALALLISVGAHAVSTTITVNATFNLLSSSLSGTASLTNLGSGGSTVSGTVANNGSA